MEIKEILKNKKVIISILIVLAIVGFLLYRNDPLGLITNNPEINVVDTSKPNVTVTDTVSSEYDVERSLYFGVNNMPSNGTLPYYTYTSLSATTNEDFINNTANKLGFTKRQTFDSPSQGTVILYVSEDGKRSLVIEEVNNLLTYSNTDYDHTKTFQDPTDPETAKNAAEDFLKETGLWIDSYKFSEYNFYEGEHGAEGQALKTFGNPNTIEIVYEGKIDVYDLTSQQSYINADELRVQVSADNFEIVSVNMNLTGTVGNKISDVKIKSQDELTKMIDNGEMKLIYSASPSNTTFDKIVVSSAELIYYTVDNKAVPAFRVNGVGENSEGQSYIVYFLANAF